MVDTPAMTREQLEAMLRFALDQQPALEKCPDCGASLPMVVAIRMGEDEQPILGADGQPVQTRTNGPCPACSLNTHVEPAPMPGEEDETLNAIGRAWRDHERDLVLSLLKAFHDDARDDLASDRDFRATLRSLFPETIAADVFEILVKVGSKMIPDAIRATMKTVAGLIAKNRHRLIDECGCPRCAARRRELSS